MQREQHSGRGADGCLAVVAGLATAGLVLVAAVLVAATGDCDGTVEDCGPVLLRGGLGIVGGLLGGLVLGGLVGAWVWVSADRDRARREAEWQRERRR